jgi:glutamate dehydrogenase
MGLLRTGTGRPRPKATQLKGEIRHKAREAALLVVTKANSVSTVHRASYLDYIGVKTFDSRGRVSGERRFLGLFTSTTYSTSPREIPLLRHKVQSVIDHIGVSSVSHDGKALINVLEGHPRDELFQASAAELLRTCRGIVNLYERRRVRLFVRRDPYQRFFSCLLFVPRDRYNTQARERIERILLEELAGVALESQVQISESTLARLQTLVRTAPGREVSADVTRIEKRITEALRIAAMASAYKLKINPHTSMTGINMAASIHFLAAIDNGGYFEGDVSRNNHFRDTLTTTPYVVNKDGCVLPLEKPGIGVEVDEDFIAKHPVIEGPSYV